MAFGLHAAGPAGTALETTATRVPPKDIIARAIDVVAKESGLTPDVILSPLRTREAVAARQKGLYLAYRLSGKSLPEIGRRFSGRDHTTVLHAVRKMETMADSDRSFRAELMRLARMVEADADAVIARSEARFARYVPLQSVSAIKL